MCKSFYIILLCKRGSNTGYVWKLIIKDGSPTVHDPVSYPEHVNIFYDVCKLLFLNVLVSSLLMWLVAIVSYRDQTCYF